MLFLPEVGERDPLAKKIFPSLTLLGWKHNPTQLSFHISRSRDLPSLLLPRRNPKMSLHQRQQQQQLPPMDDDPVGVGVGVSASQKPSSSSSTTLARPAFMSLLAILLLLGVLFPSIGFLSSSWSFSSSALARWNDYTLAEAVAFVGGQNKNNTANGTVIVCAVSEPYLPFLNNWLISISRQGHLDRVLVVAEDYSTLYKVNRRWPGHAVLIPPAPTTQSAHKFGSQGFFNFTSRRPRHLLQILELGYNVMYNDVDMVWLSDPFPYFVGNRDVYFTDDMSGVKPLDHPHTLPPPGKKGRTYICSCMIFLRPTVGAKKVLKRWIEELQAQPWSKKARANDQPAFNWALNKTADQVDVYLLPQAAFPSGGLYFKNETWVRETKGMHVIIHNNYILGFEKKIKRFHEFGLWLVDDYAHKSPLGKL